ncbi:unnamed protein product [Dovyalis caffra]|uniref:Uncharacterized protein n=1 Tax=Dovyalis caffra TaxID=77055 RepID=A0AAV1SWB9_9ROSI|nr:unnamed protein product [Dovyalis caffra]
MQCKRWFKEGASFGVSPLHVPRTKSQIRIHNNAETDKIVLRFCVVTPMSTRRSYDYMGEKNSGHSQPRIYWVPKPHGIDHTCKKQMQKADRQ